MNGSCALHDSMEFAAICEDTILEFHVFPCGDFQRGFCAKHGARGKAPAARKRLLDIYIYICYFFVLDLRQYVM